MNTRIDHQPFIAFYTLAIAFGHHWADMLRLDLAGPSPSVDSPEGAAAYKRWAERYNNIRPVDILARWRGKSVEQLRAAIKKAEDQQVDRFVGVDYDAGHAHTTQSGTLSWVCTGKLVMITARRRWKDESGSQPVWWVASLADGEIAVTRYNGAPTGPGDRWEDDGGQQNGNYNGKYTWEILANALKALGAEIPALPPAAPPSAQLPVGGRRNMRRVV